MDKVALLIPCYNEEQTIEKVIKDAKKYIPEAIIYVYDNNSNDNTAKIASENGAIVRREYSQGKGNVVRRMFREIEAECYVMIDGDDTYPLEFAREMINKIIIEKKDMVIGDRLSSTYFSENKRRFHGIGNLLVRKSINNLFGCNIRDIMTGYRAFGYNYVKTFPVLSKGFEIETEMSIHAAYYNMCMDNVIVEYRDRPKGSVSKLNTYKDGMHVIITIIKLFKNYKPMGFFGMLSILLFGLSSIFFCPIMLSFIKTGVVLKVPTLLVCGCTYLAALQTLFTGIILSSNAQKDKRDFESKLVLCETFKCHYGNNDR